MQLRYTAFALYMSIDVKPDTHAAELNPKPNTIHMQLRFTALSLYHVTCGAFSRRESTRATLTYGDNVVP